MVDLCILATSVPAGAATPQLFSGDPWFNDLSVLARWIFLYFPAGLMGLYLFAVAVSGRKLKPMRLVLVGLGPPALSLVSGIVLVWASQLLPKFGMDWELWVYFALQAAAMACVGGLAVLMALGLEDSI